MKKKLLIPLGFALLLAGEALSAPSSFLFEWVSRAQGSVARLILFQDRTLVYKIENAAGTKLQKRVLSSEEYDYYVTYFSAPDSLDAAGDYTTGATGDSIAVSMATFHLPSGKSWAMSFDPLSALTYDALRIKTALEGLRDSIGHVLPSPSDFAPEKMPPGTVLKRRDGALFKVIAFNKDKGIVEIQGINEPYSEWVRDEQLRFVFYPPHS